MPAIQVIDLRMQFIDLFAKRDVRGIGLSANQPKNELKPHMYTGKHR
jgi:hypothetical protein